MDEMIRQVLADVAKVREKLENDTEMQKSTVSLLMLLVSAPPAVLMYVLATPGIRAHVGNCMLALMRDLVPSNKLAKMMDYRRKPSDVDTMLEKLGVNTESN